jgi:hypothetical protein
MTGMRPALFQAICLILLLLPASGASADDRLAEQLTSGGHVLMVLVTHHVTIAGIAGRGVSSGEGVVLRLSENGGYEVVGNPGFGF